MNIRKWHHKRLYLHLLGLLALLLIHFVSDFHHFQLREGFSKFSPYLFLLLLYGWIIFHNLILFDGLFLAGKRRAYFKWTFLAIGISSLNMFFILHYGFSQSNILIQILNFWQYSLLGLGVYMTFRYLKDFGKSTLPIPSPEGKEGPINTHFDFTADGEKQLVPFEKILYLESMENYVKVHTKQKTWLVRLSMKEAEVRLPVPLFIRISRSHILNSSNILSFNHDLITAGDQTFKIGKVYKKYVEDQLGALVVSNS